MTFHCFPHDFFLPTAAIVAPLLLGHTLWRRIGEDWAAAHIVEVEAYLEDDPACHAYKRRTPRVETIYGPPGHAYIYFTYGCHHCFNIVCRPKDTAEAVLIRALEPVEGLDLMRSNRPVLRDRDLLSGPGKICQALDLNLTQNGRDLCTPNVEIVLTRNPHAEEFNAARSPLVQTTRIGLTKAADWPLRWYLKGSKSVSRY